MFQYAVKFLPKRFVKNYEALIKYSSIKTDPDKFIGFVFLFGLGIALAVALFSTILFLLTIDVFLIIFTVIFSVFETAIYMGISISADSKGRFVENILPDVLQLMAMNIKSGMTTDKALLVVARPEFGPLEKELLRAGKEVLSGKEIKDALLGIPTRIKSTVLDRTIRMIVEGIESGGELSDLLTQTAEDIQSSKIVQSEVHANVMMYAIFIFFAAGIGAPLLFGISTYLVEILSSQYSSFDMGDAMTSQIQFGSGGGNITISGDFLILFSILSMSVTSLFGGMIIGIVKGGSEKDGFKLIPVLLILSLVIFFAVRMMVGSIFSGL
jgi:pilus assembly protein TadC